jgi:hypothetical protein
VGEQLPEWLVRLLLVRIPGHQNLDGVLHGRHRSRTRRHGAKHPHPEGLGSSPVTRVDSSKSNRCLFRCLRSCMRHGARTSQSPTRPPSCRPPTAHSEKPTHSNAHNSSASSCLLTHPPVRPPARPLAPPICPTVHRFPNPLGGNTIRRSLSKPTRHSTQHSLIRASYITIRTRAAAPQPTAATFQPNAGVAQSRLTHSNPVEAGQCHRPPPTTTTAAATAPPWGCRFAMARNPGRATQTGDRTSANPRHGTGAGQNVRGSLEGAAIGAHPHLGVAVVDEDHVERHVRQRNRGYGHGRRGSAAWKEREGGGEGGQAFVERGKRSGRGTRSRRK